MKPERPRCAVEDCDRAQWRRSPWCRMHATRYQRHGDPLITLLPRRVPDPRPKLAEAAAQLGICGRRVQTLIDEGRLTGEKVGKGWRIDPASIAAYAASPRKAGRPRKEQGNA